MLKSHLGLLHELHSLLDGPGCLLVDPDQLVIGHEPWPHGCSPCHHLGHKQPSVTNIVLVMTTVHHGQTVPFRTTPGQQESTIKILSNIVIQPDLNVESLHVKIVNVLLTDSHLETMPPCLRDKNCTNCFYSFRSSLLYIQTFYSGVGLMVEIIVSSSLSEYHDTRLNAFKLRSGNQR